MASIDAQQPDSVYCLGDLVGYNTWPNEVVDMIRSRGIPVIKGNYDEGIGLATGDCGCAYKTETDQQMGQQSIAYTDAVVSDATRAYLRSLPAHIRVDFSFPQGPLSLLMVHGSPRKINEYLFEDRPEQSLVRMMTAAGADILCFGHTHKPFHRALQTEGKTLHAINTGSVGKPKDGDPRGCYVLLEINAPAAMEQPVSVAVSFVRFHYDVEAAARAIEASVLPDAYAAMIRNAY